MSFLAFIWSYLGGARRDFVCGVVMAFVEGVAAAVPAVAVGLALARLAGDGGQIGLPHVAPYAAAIVLAVLVRLVAIRLAWRWGFAAGNVATEAVLNRLVEHMRRTPLGILDRWRTARLATLVTEDGRWFNEAATFTLSRVLAGAATTASLLAVILWLDPVVGLAVTAAFAAAFAAVPVTARVLKDVLARRNAHLTDATQRIGEYSEGIAVFRSFGRTGAALQQLRQAVDQLHDLLVRKGPLLALLQQVTTLPAGLSAGAAVVLLAAMVLWAGYTPDIQAVVPALFLSLAAKNALIIAVLKPIVVLRLGQQAQAGMVAFLKEPVLAGASSVFGSPLDVRFDAVSFAYARDKAPAVRDVSFVAGQGAVTAIVGPSGAGKSTVTALLLRFFDADSGGVSVGGLDARMADPARLQALVSLVNQDVHLFHDTLRANLLLGRPSADEVRLGSAISAARLDELVSALPDGLDTILGGAGRTLSGGERQRVAIARALLKDAPIVVLDEATSAMDPLAERSIQQAVAALERGRTVIVIAHRLRTVAEADQILVMDEGRIVERGRHRELLDVDGVYARLWRAQERAAGWRLR